MGGRLERVRGGGRYVGNSLLRGAGAVVGAFGVASVARVAPREGAETGTRGQVRVVRGVCIE